MFGTKKKLAELMEHALKVSKEQYETDSKIFALERKLDELKDYIDRIRIEFNELQHHVYQKERDDEKCAMCQKENAKGNKRQKK